MKMGVFAGVETGPVSQGRFPAFLPQVSRWRSVDVSTLGRPRFEARPYVLAQCSSKGSLTLTCTGQCFQKVEKLKHECFSKLSVHSIQKIPYFQRIIRLKKLSTPFFTLEIRNIKFNLIQENKATELCGFAWPTHHLNGKTPCGLGIILGAQNPLLFQHRITLGLQKSRFAIRRILAVVHQQKSAQVILQKHRRFGSWDLSHSHMKLS